MPHLPDLTTATESQMDQLRIPTLALDHIARLQADAEHDRRLQTTQPAQRPAFDRLSTWLAPRRAERRHLKAELC
jgi:hypothetical protein